MKVLSPILTIDVGNTFTKIAVFHGKEIHYTDKLEQLDLRKLRSIVKEKEIQGIAYSASGDDDQEVLNWIDAYEAAIFLSSNVQMPVEIMYTTPHTLGQDRIAAVMGAYSLYPNENVLVVDIGTCITYDLLNKEGQYVGGNISPGVKMRLDAMNHFTDRLPLIDLKPMGSKEDYWIGNSTETAIRNGAVVGTEMELKSFISRAKEFFGTCKIVFTGGGAKYYVEKFEEEIIYDPFLIHRGLREILIYNEK